MHLEISKWQMIPVLGLVFSVWVAPGAAQMSNPSSAAIVDGRCATCHNEQGTNPQALAPAVLAQMTPERIYQALTSGPMAEINDDLTDEQRRGVAAFIAGRPLGSGDRSASGMMNRCTAGAMGAVTRGPRWTGWSVDLKNWRYQPDPGLTADQLSDLELKWAFGLPGASAMRGQPTVAGGRVFIASDASMVYSLDARTGCVHWSYEAKGPIMTMVTVGPFPGPGERSAVYFGDIRANVYALDAATGEQLWTVNVGDHPLARISAPGGPALVAEEGILVVPIAGWEENMLSVEDYECCTFRGSVVLLDARNGRRIWKTHVIPTAAKPFRRNAAGTQLYGPSGGSVWTTPTVDLTRRAVYVGTANGSPQMPRADGGESGATDAIVAFDLDTGERRWIRQLQFGDINRASCGETPEEQARNCPLPPATPGVADPLGFKTSNDDVPLSPILFTRSDGKDLLLVGQESRRMAVLDPDNEGTILWQGTPSERETRTTGNLGPAYDGELLYVGLAYRGEGDERDASEGGLVAFRPETGEVVWTTNIPAPESCSDTGPRCTSGIQGSLTVIPGAVFAGAGDGTVRAFSSETGRVLWEFNTDRDFESVNGVPAHGGTLGGGGTTVVGGMVYVGSGYTIVGGKPGNVLLVFGVD